MVGVLPVMRLVAAGTALAAKNHKITWPRKMRQGQADSKGFATKAKN
jgi:hypothetical protein